MKELVVKTSFSGVDMDVKFTDKINFIVQDSGTGKSYLFGLLSEYCQSVGISCLLFNHVTLPFVGSLRDISVGKDVVILDNADMYMDSDLLSFFESSDCLVIVSIKSVAELHSDCAGYYFVDYKDEVIRTERVKDE